MRPQKKKKVKIVPSTRIRGNRIALQKSHLSQRNQKDRGKGFLNGRKGVQDDLERWIRGTHFACEEEKENRIIVSPRGKGFISCHFGKKGGGTKQGSCLEKRGPDQKKKKKARSIPIWVGRKRRIVSLPRENT